MKKYILASGLIALTLVACQQKEEAPKAEVKKEEKPAQTTEVKKEETKAQEQAQEQTQEQAKAEEAPKAEQPSTGMQAVAVSAEEVQALIQQKGCVACHDVNTKKVGPSFKEVAAKYSGQADAVATLVNSITKGSTGKWGSIPMPPQPVKQEEAQKIVSWVLTLK